MADVSGKGNIVVAIALTASAVMTAIAIYGCLGPIAGYFLVIATCFGLFAGTHWLLWGRTMPTEPPDESERR